MDKCPKCGGQLIGAIGDASCLQCGYEPPESHAMHLLAHGFSFHDTGLQESLRNRAVDKRKPNSVNGHKPKYPSCDIKLHQKQLNDNIYKSAAIDVECNIHKYTERWRNEKESILHEFILGINQ